MANKVNIEQARLAITTFRDAAREGREINFRQRDPLVAMLHAALDELEQANATITRLQAERDKWLKAFNDSEQFQSGPMKRAEAAEADLAKANATIRRVVASAGVENVDQAEFLVTLAYQHRLELDAEIAALEADLVQARARIAQLEKGSLT